MGMWCWWWKEKEGEREEEKKGNPVNLLPNKARAKFYKHWIIKL